MFVVVEHAEDEQAPDEAEAEAGEEKTEEPAAAEDAETEAGEDAEAATDEGDAEDAAPALVANRIEVETGLEDSDFVEVVSGIDDESLIVVLGQHTLKSGSRVRITNAAAEIEAKSGLSAEEALEAAKAKQEAKSKEKEQKGE